MTSILSLQQHPVDVVLPFIGINKVTSQKGILKMGKYTKNMNLTQKFYIEKQMSVIFTLSQCMSGDGIE